jgi:MFS family permease
MSEMIEACRENYPEFDQDRAGSILSGIFSAGYGIGLALGPSSGATLYSFVGFRMTLNITALIVAL